MYKIKQIIENQEKHKKEIISFFKRDYKETKKFLKKINTKDEFISKKKEELLEKFKRFKVTDGVEKLFFMHPKRNETYYVWWDNENNEAIVLKYEKK
jgi:hypothetical protein